MSAAYRPFLERQLLATPQRQMSSSMAATLRAWQKRRDNIDDAAADREPEEEQTLGPLTRMIIDRAYDFGSVQELIAND